MSITILKPGIMSSVQDLGRWGFQQFGVPIGGAIDKLSTSLANIICGNDENEAVIEMTLHGTSILFNENTYCTFTGGGCKVYVDDIELPFNRLLYIPAFSIITTKPAARGCRTYFAVTGGLDIPKTMGSASTYAPSGIGGIQGRNLITGDILHFKKRDHSISSSSMKILGNNIHASHWQVPDLFTHEKDREVIHVVPGPEYDLFDEASRIKFFQSNYTIGLQSNRMGYRLEGEKLLLKEKKEMVSTPVASGIIQVTHDGTPIILMADAQTTGGYPRIARVCSTHMPILAQKRPGEKIRFNQINEEESLHLYNELRRTMKILKTIIEIPT
jgi:antagonist of KipI